MRNPSNPQKLQTKIVLPQDPVVHNPRYQTNPQLSLIVGYILLLTPDLANQWN